MRDVVESGVLFPRRRAGRRLLRRAISLIIQVRSENQNTLININLKDSFGVSSLGLAPRFGIADVVKLLVDAGTKIDDKDKDKRPEVVSTFTGARLGRNPMVAEYRPLFVGH